MNHRRKRKTKEYDIRPQLYKPAQFFVCQSANLVGILGNLRGHLAASGQPSEKTMAVAVRLHHTFAEKRGM